MTEARRKWQRSRRRKAAGRGKCSTCAKRWPVYPNKTCNPCLDTRTRSYAKARPKENA